MDQVDRLKSLVYFIVLIYNPRWQKSREIAKEGDESFEKALIKFGNAEILSKWRKHKPRFYPVEKYIEATNDCAERALGKWPNFYKKTTKENRRQMLIFNSYFL